MKLKQRNAFSRDHDGKGFLFFFRCINLLHIMSVSLDPEYNHEKLSPAPWLQPGSTLLLDLGISEEHFWDTKKRQFLASIALEEWVPESLASSLRAGKSQFSFYFSWSEERVSLSVTTPSHVWEVGPVWLTIAPMYRCCQVRTEV